MNITIRPLEENDAYTSVKWRNIPEIWELTGSRPDHTISIQEELEWIRKVIQDKTCRRFAIIADDEYVGNIYLTNIKYKTAEYHIFIGNKDYWGKGIAGKATELIIKFGKDKLGLDAIYLSVNKDNAAAVHLYEKFGFKKTEDESNNFIKMRLELNDKK